MDFYNRTTINLLIQVGLRLYVTELFDWLTVKFRLNTLFIFSNTNYGLYPGYFDVSTTIVSLEYNSPDIDCPSFSRPVDPYLGYGMTSSLVTLTYRRRWLRVPLTAWVLANENHLCLFVSRLHKKSLLPFEKKKEFSRGLKSSTPKLLKKNY